MTTVRSLFMIQGFNLKRFCFGLCFLAGSLLGVTAVYTKVGAGKERNKGAALTREELMTAEGIAAVSALLPALHCASGEHQFHGNDKSASGTDPGGLS